MKNKSSTYFDSQNTDSIIAVNLRSELPVMILPIVTGSKFTGWYWGGLWPVIWSWPSRRITPGPYTGPYSA